MPIDRRLGGAPRWLIGYMFVCLAAACVDKGGEIREFIVLRPRPGEEEVPNDRAVSMLLGMATNLRSLADNLEQTAEALHVAAMPDGGVSN